MCLSYMLLYDNNDVVFITPPKVSPPSWYSITLVCLDVEVTPKIPRTKSKAVSEVNDPFLHNKAGPGELTIEEIYRLLKEGSKERTSTWNNLLG